MGIRAIHTLGGEVYFVETPFDEWPSENIERFEEHIIGEKNRNFPLQQKSDMQLYREHLAKTRNKKAPD